MDLIIRRDTYGIAHIRAQSLTAGFYGQGLVHVEDRWTQMDGDRRRAYGRTAELLGESAVAVDQFWRPLGIGTVVREEYRQLDEATRRMVDAYARGVNAALAVPPACYVQLGWPVEPWQPWDSLAVMKARHLLMGVVERKLWWAKVAETVGRDRLGALVRAMSGPSLVIVPPGQGTTAPPLEVDGVALPDNSPPEGSQGSNSWVLAGGRTSSGRPILAGDPHRGLEVPNVYYPVHLTVPDWDAIGESFAGVPGLPHFGHNQRVAWAITHTGADTQDLYVEHLRDPECEYQADEEMIQVAGAAPRSVTVARTRRGPVIHVMDDKTTGLALRATALDPAPEQYACLHRMLGASSLEALFESQRGWVDPVNNFLGADQDGHIGYLMRGRVPVRSKENLLGPVPGGDPLYQWQGDIPFSDLPRVEDPEEGIIVTANNRVVGPDYPYLIAPVFAAEHRARRIWSLLSERRAGWTAEDMATIHLDVVSAPARTFAAWAQGLSPNTPTESLVLGWLATWDGQIVEDSPLPLVYNAWRQKLTRVVMTGLVGEKLAGDAESGNTGAVTSFSRVRARLMDLLAEHDDALLPNGSSWEAAAREAFHAAVTQLLGQYGSHPEQWRWGLAHQVVAHHPLAGQAGLAGLPAIAARLPGDSDTVRAASYGAATFAVTGTSVARYVFDLDHWDHSAWIIPGGVAEMGAHALDQLDSWKTGGLAPMWFTEAAVSSHVVEERVLPTPRLL